MRDSNLYQVGDIVIFHPRDNESCYSPVVRSPDVYRHYDAKPGDRLKIVKRENYCRNGRMLSLWTWCKTYLKHLVERQLRLKQEAPTL